LGLEERARGLKLRFGGNDGSQEDNNRMSDWPNFPSRLIKVSEINYFE